MSTPVAPQVGVGSTNRIEAFSDAVFAIYGVGWLAVFLCFAALYWRADAMLEARLALTFGMVGALSAVLAARYAAG